MGGLFCTKTWNMTYVKSTSLYKTAGEQDPGVPFWHGKTIVGQPQDMTQLVKNPSSITSKEFLMHTKMVSKNQGALGQMQICLTLRILFVMHNYI